LRFSTQKRLSAASPGFCSWQAHRTRASNHPGPDGWGWAFLWKTSQTIVTPSGKRHGRGVTRPWAGLQVGATPLQARHPPSLKRLTATAGGVMGPFVGLRLIAAATNSASAGDSGEAKDRARRTRRHPPAYPHSLEPAPARVTPPQGVGSLTPMKAYVGDVRYARSRIPSPSRGDSP
jgi:hypothetical protein